MPKLSPTAITDALQNLNGWDIQQEALHKEFEFENFKQAMAFVNQVADAANAADHHPDIDIRYNKVTLALATHSEGGITEKDVDMAKQIKGLG